MTKCPKCNSDVKKGALFCTQCGIKLFSNTEEPLYENLINADKKCPKCNSDIKKGALFCTQCGIRLSNNAEEPKNDNLFIFSNDAFIKSVNMSDNKKNINTDINNPHNLEQLADKKEIHTYNKNPKALYTTSSIAILIILILSFLGYKKTISESIIPYEDFNTASMQNNNIATVDSLHNIETTKYFVQEQYKGSNIYYEINFKAIWPNTIKECNTKILQTEIIHKTFGLSDNNSIYTILPAYFQSYGKEISNLPEISDTTYDQRYITINIDTVSYIRNKYIAFSIKYMETCYGGSIHAADIWTKYVNYDIKNNKVISLSDILTNNTSEKDVLNELKRSLSIDIDGTDTLSDEVLLTEKGLFFILKSNTNDSKTVGLNLSNDYISPNIKEFFQIKEEYNETEGKKFLKDIYENYIFGNQDFGSIAPNICSERILQRLKEAFDYDCEDGECYAVWLFRTNYQDGPNNINIVNDIIAKDNGWFDVYYTDMGHNGKTSFKLQKVDDEIKIDEIFLDKTYISNYNEQENSNPEDLSYQESEEMLYIFNEPAYLMNNDEIQNELIGTYYWQCASDNPEYINPNHNTLGITIRTDGLVMSNEFVKAIHNNSATSNINGSVPAYARYEKGHWYKQNNTQNHSTMYYLVGHELNIEVMNFSNRNWIGNEEIHFDGNPNAFIIMMKNNNGNWYYTSNKGNYTFKKN